MARSICDLTPSTGLIRLRVSTLSSAKRARSPGSTVATSSSSLSTRIGRMGCSRAYDSEISASASFSTRARAEADLGYIEVRAQDAGERLLIDPPRGEQPLPEGSALPPLDGQRRLQLLGSQQSVFEEQLAQPLLGAHAESAAGLALDR